MTITNQIISRVCFVIIITIIILNKFSTFCIYSTWGESLVLSVQILIVGLLILMHNGKHKASIAYVAVYLISMTFLLSPWMPMQVHILLQIFSVPFSASSKVRKPDCSHVLYLF